MPFACNAALLISGDIVRVENPTGPSGRPTYPHQFVVMSVPTQLKAGDEISCIGISSRTPKELFDPALHVSLKWMARPGGHPATGLTMPSLAKVTFGHTLVVKAGKRFSLEAEAEFRGKYVPADQFHTMVAVANAYDRKSR